MSPPITRPEQRAREQIDALLGAAGWAVQDLAAMNLSAARGVAVREFPTASGPADYLLFVDGQAVGVLEAKPEGFTLSGVEGQARRYAEGLPDTVDAPVLPLPFAYLSTGVETRFTNRLDLRPRTRRVFSFHRPETLAGWLAAPTLHAWVRGLADRGGLFTAADDSRPSSLRSRLQTLPPLEPTGLYPVQVRAIQNLEASLVHDRPRALVQMATGSGKTRMAIAAVYRLLKFAGATRVLFVVDRANLGEQAEKEFQAFVTPDDHRRFTDLYTVQRLTSNTIRGAANVVITTIQRLYATLQGAPEIDPLAEEASDWEDERDDAPLPVVYNAALPPEMFDVVLVDECHRSIYTLWRQVLEYFDAFLVGLTATPSRQTYGFFEGNVVMEYRHDEAVADHVNVDYDVYRIRTVVGERGATLTLEPAETLPYRVVATRETRWERPEGEVKYDAAALDRRVVSTDRLRLIARTLHERLFTELFPGRHLIPKTLVFARDDSHAEDVVEVFRAEFGGGDEVCQKITYRTTEARPADLIQSFRNSFYPRIAVTVDMIATGTDIKPVEIIVFLRAVKSRLLLEQMIGRGVRVIDATTLRSVTDDAEAKTHFVVIDAVGALEGRSIDGGSLERRHGLALTTLLDLVAEGSADSGVLSSLAGRLARIERRIGPDDRRRVPTVTGGLELSELAARLVAALDGETLVADVRATLGLPAGAEVPVEALGAAWAETLHEAAASIRDSAALRALILELNERRVQLIDEQTEDHLLSAGFSAEARERARALTQSFEAYLAEHRDELDALRFFYAQPHARRLRYDDLRALSASIQAPPRAWTPEALWRAYQVLEKDRVKGASGRRLLTDLVSLVRFALHQQNLLEPFGHQVRLRFENWLAQQQNRGRRFTDEQLRWLTMMRDHVAANVEIEVEDFDRVPFFQEGGLGAAARVFGKELGVVLRELNEVLAA